MARAFDDGSSQYLEVSGAPATDCPLTIACWANSDDTDNLQSLVCLGDAAGGSCYFALLFRGDATEIVQCAVIGASGFKTAAATVAYSASTWHHVCGTFTSDTARACYLDGANKGTSATDSGAVTGIDITEVGDHFANNVRGYYFSGSIAEAAMWSAALTDAEVAALAAGASPLTIRPESLVAYWPLIRDEDQDVVGAYDLTDANNPTIATHPPGIFGRARTQVMVPAAAAGVIAQIGSVTWASVGQLAGVAEASISQVAGVAAN